MRTALDGVLAVDEGVVLVAVLVGVGQRNLDIFAFEVDDRVERRDRHILRQEVQETILRGIFLAVINECQAGIEVRVVTQQFLDIVVAKMVVLEEPFAAIGHELDDCTAAFGTGIGLNTGIGSQFALRKLCATCATIAEGLHGEERRQGVDGFGTDTVQTDGFLVRY